MCKFLLCGNWQIVNYWNIFIAVIIIHLSMAHRYWEGAKIASRYAKYRPVPPTGLINRILGFLKEKYTGPLNLAYDVGCGSGQSTQFWAPHFTKVVGTDLSKAQVDQAIDKNKNSNVIFKVSPAETIPEPNSSVQLISASQAAHWFDLPKFYDEGKRVLTPGGVLCLIGYDLPKMIWSKDPSKEEHLNSALMDIYKNGLKGFWDDPTREIVDSRYAPYIIPYDDFTRDESFYHDIETSVEDIVMLTTTWSGFNNFCQKKGDQEGAKLLDKYRSRIMEVLNVSTSSEETMVTKRTCYFVLMGRKPL